MSDERQEKIARGAVADRLLIRDERQPVFCHSLLNYKVGFV